METVNGEFIMKACEDDDPKRLHSIDDLYELVGDIGFIPLFANEISGYYSALGSELVKSKFFHLYAIIEFCEREFEDYNGAKRLFDDEDVEDVVGQISVAIGEKNKPNIISRVKQLFTSITDIGRTQKLLNILKHMGIDKYAQYGTDKDINKNDLDEIIKLRNKSFHGASESDDNEYRSAVEKLLYIDEKILEYVIGKKHKAIEPNGYVFITGQRNEQESEEK